MILAERIKQARLAAGLTQTDLAVKLRAHGVRTAQATVYMWEAGQRVPGADACRALAAVLGIETPDDHERWTVVGRSDVRDEIDRRRGRRSRASFIAGVLELVDDPTRKGGRE